MKCSLRFKYWVVEVKKGLAKCAKISGCEALTEWIKHCVNHLYWSTTTTFSGNGDVIWAKFKSFFGHIVNKHSGFSDPLFDKCEHDNDIQPRKWLHEGKRVVIITTV